MLSLETEQKKKIAPTNKIFLLFWLRKLPKYYFLAQAFAKLHGKLGPKNNIPEVFLTKKTKNMNHGSPLFPTIQIRLKTTDQIVSSH